MRAAFLILCGLALMGAAWGAEIRVTSDPPLPVPNLVKNQGGEAGDAGKPADWRFTTAIPDNFETGWGDDGRSGKCVWLKAKTGRMSGYWSQSVPVEGGKSYLFRGHLRLGGGKVLCYVHARNRLPDGRSIAIDERTYRGSMRGHWLIPVFLPPDSLGGPDPRQWYPFRIPVRIPEGMTAAAFSLGIFFTPGEAAFDDLWAGLGETELAVTVKAGEGETLRRVTVTPIGSDKPVFDSKPLAGGTREFETKLAGQPTDNIYEVAATLEDGKVVTARYPEAGETK